MPTNPPRKSKPAQLGRRIREEREALGIKQAVLARAIGLPREALCRIESGEYRCPSHLVFFIGAYLGVSTDRLHGLSPALQLRAAS